MAILDACGFHAVRGVKVLIQKALITISDRKFDMHDLVQEMGHYIVRGKHPNNPEKHSRVWKKEDVLKICDMDATKKLDMIKAIRFQCHYKRGLLPPFVENMKSLRWFDLSGNLASPFPTNFPPVELCYLSLNDISQKQLWDGYKHLPNLKVMELVGLERLIMTPDFDGVPNLERFSLFRCPELKKIHPSIGRLQKLVFLSFAYCPELFTLSEIQQQKMGTNFFVSCWMCGDRDVEQCSLEDPCLPHNNMNPHTLLQFFPTSLRKLKLTFCNVGDNIIGSAVWEFPNLEELILQGNRFTRLDFNVLRLPRLKYLDVRDCEDLVELSELPSSIAVVEADRCRSLENFGNISNCKWLWKVSVRVRGVSKLGPHDGDKLLDSMLQGNALENHFISVGLDKHQMIPKRFVGRMYRGKTFTMHLPDDWYNDYCGFLICVVTIRAIRDTIEIVMKQEPHEDSPSELWQESSDYKPWYMVNQFDDTRKSVAYVSFSSLRLLKPSYKIISFSVDHVIGGYGNYGNDYAETCDIRVGGELVPRKTKVDEEEVQAADCSEFWDNQYEDGTTFTIQHESESSIKILWEP